MTQLKNIETQIKVIKKGTLPSKKHKKDACYDMYAREVNWIYKDLFEVKLGVAITPPPGYRVAIYPRSSISKTGWMLANGVGIGDENYTGEYKAYFNRTRSGEEFPYKVGDRVCQMEIVPYRQIIFKIVEELKPTERKGGFGSTGK